MSDAQKPAAYPVRFDYRSQARRAVSRVDGLLAEGTDAALHYAALELRFALEALTYDRAYALKAEFPPEEYATWQPAKVMEVVLEIDPSYLTPAEIRFGEEPAPGVAPPDSGITSLGTDTPLTKGDVKNHYNALGNYLHIPTFDQLSKGKGPDYVKMRQRCEVVAAIVRRVLSSPVWNARFTESATLSQCLGEGCGKPVHVALRGKASVTAKCHDPKCPATYDVTVDDTGKVAFDPRQQRIVCATPDCDATGYIWPADVVEGAVWKCGDCGSEYVFRMGFVKTEKG